MYTKNVYPDGYGERSYIRREMWSKMCTLEFCWGIRRNRVARKTRDARRWRELTYCRKVAQGRRCPNHFTLPPRISSLDPSFSVHTRIIWVYMYFLSNFHFLYPAPPFFCCLFSFFSVTFFLFTFLSLFFYPFLTLVFILLFSLPHVTEPQNGSPFGITLVLFWPLEVLVQKALDKIIDVST